MNLTLLVVLLNTPPEGWVPHPGPGPEFEGDRVCANHSRREWVVEAVGGHVRVAAAPPDPRQEALPFPIQFQSVLPQPPSLPSPKGTATPRKWDPAEYAEKHARRSIIQLRDGWLVGFNAGEYGGSLWWSTQASSPGLKLSDEHVISIMPTQDRKQAFVFVGLAHMGTDRGEVLRFHLNGGRPTLAHVAKLGAEPEALAPRPDGSTLVLTKYLLLTLSPERGITTLCTVNYWGLYPRSMAVLDNGQVYVGMRHFLGRLTPRPNSTCSVEWFAPADCPRFVRGDEGCVCHE